MAERDDLNAESEQRLEALASIIGVPSADFWSGVLAVERDQFRALLQLWSMLSNERDRDDALAAIHDVVARARD